jgi:ABC-2 type transport system ATP-binding protein
MNAIEVQQLSYRYGRKTEALHDVTIDVPRGAIYGLIGPNGAGKSTLLQCCAGLRYAHAGRVHVFGVDARKRSPIVAGVMTYMAEAVKLPERMTLGQLEAYIAPLHAKWDFALAASLRDRFALDPSRKVGTLSRGEHMKAALLCALAPRPTLLLMDEPFTGMDVMVKDELVRGLLASATDAGTTIMVASHDLTELETVIDHLGIISNAKMVVSASMDSLRARFRRVHVQASSDVLVAAGHDDGWLGVEQAGRRMSFMADASRTSLLPESLQQRFPGADVEFTEPTLRELLTSLAGRAGTSATMEMKP